MNRSGFFLSCLIELLQVLLSGRLACLIFKFLGLLFALLLYLRQVLVVFICQALHLPFVNLGLLPLSQAGHQTLLAIPLGFLRASGGCAHIGASIDCRSLEVIDWGWLEFAFHHLLT